MKKQANDILIDTMRSIKNKLICFSIAAAATLPHPYANAYELGTHARLTYKAYEQSALAQDQDLIKNLGIDTLIVTNPSNPFGEAYYDVGDTDVRERQVDPFEKGFMTEREDNPSPVIPPSVTDLSLPGWLLRGAIREDDYPFGPNPMDDPVNAIRPFNHFYDPAQNRALTTILGITLGEKAPDWGLGTRDVFDNANGENIFRNNHYSVFDARESMYRALTGKNKDNQDVAPTKDDRNKYWATLFRALGDIVHLVQDMGQSQHMRNASQINGTHHARNYA